MECKQNSKLNNKKVNLNQDKNVKRSNTSSSVKKKKKNNVLVKETTKKTCTRTESQKDLEQYGDNLEIEGVQLKTPREGEEYEDEKTESNGEKDEIKGDNSTEANSEINEDKPSSANLNNKSMSSASVVESVSTALSQVSLKQKNNVQKTNKPKGSNPRILNNTQNGARNAKKINSDSKTSIYSSSSNSRLKNESLRWELECDDLEEEEERIRVYKINRRKRYLAAAQAKGLGWVANYASNGSPVSEDSGIEMRERETNLYSLKDTHKSVNDFSTLQTLGPTHSNMNNGVAVDC